MDYLHYFHGYGENRALWLDFIARVCWLVANGLKQLEKLSVCEN